jgi:hypothetical protein
LPQRGRGLVVPAGSRRRLDQLDQRPAAQAQFVVAGCAFGGGERGRVSTEPVVQHGRHVLG